ncbi:stage V sporulation protein AC [Haloimpatiens sp. FM7330]|uniref:stage V sporulation protein AC n=1 Tax=Haloimpatiens sp. FM7330 TaxID=3298610 RepID=UPI0036324C7D
MNNKKNNKKEQEIRTKFQKLSSKENPKSTLGIDCIKAFFVGGLICDIGQFFFNSISSFGLPKDQVSTIVSIIMIFIGAFLTGIGIYDRIGEFGGAGTIVPITGFANSIVSPAMEFKKEGFVFGVAAKMFTIAGPVLVYGVGSSVIVGIIYYFIK